MLLITSCGIPGESRVDTIESTIDEYFRLCNHECDVILNVIVREKEMWIISLKFYIRLDKI